MQTSREQTSLPFIEIGDVAITKSLEAEYTVQTYSGGSIGIRGLVQSETDVKLTEEQLYLLREGRVSNVQIQTDDGRVVSGVYRIRELNWKKERKSDNIYQLRFNIGIQKEGQN
jgi:hypothetical protein